MKTLIVTGGSLDICWVKEFIKTINAEYIIAADSGLKYIDELEHQYNRVMEMISRV